VPEKPSASSRYRSAVPRKKPKQERSKATVDAIVEATGQVFEERGFHKTTTVHVAERAGVSVGSLYQYFPDKRALIAGFFERRLEQDVSLMHAILARGAESSPAALIRVSAEEMVRVYREERALYRSVVEILPLMEETEELQVGLGRAVMLAAHFLRSRPDVLRGRDPELLATMVFYGMRGALNAVMARTPEKLDDPHLAEALAGGARGFLGIDEER
jgi:AcrR family transcriptional regulator